MILTMLCTGHGDYEREASKELAKIFMTPSIRLWYSQIHTSRYLTNQ
jgi:hypothetical protein